MKEEKSMLAITLSCITFVIMILAILFFPSIQIKKLKISTYWVIPLISAIALVVLKQINIKELIDITFHSSNMNPFKILLLFLSMTLLSIFLDEVGFFRYLAFRLLKNATQNQIQLFIILYIVVSFLTVFTSNDIIILTFTPFICYFSKHAHIDPIPYLISEFVAANTMSMMLMIGNPTNIYIATSNGVDFMEYLKIMALPTISASIVAFFILFLLFYKKLKVKAEVEIEEVKVEKKAFVINGIVHLCVCTLLLAVAAYIHIEMWQISALSACSLMISTLIISWIKKDKSHELLLAIKRLPWELIPFLLSMFIIVFSLKQSGFTNTIYQLFNKGNPLFLYGYSSFFLANIMNNIPMSVFYCSVMESLEGASLNQAIFATIMGSNLGAYLTPIGALAGIMFSNLLKKHEVKFSFLQFMGYGILISIPTISVGLLILSFIL